MPTSVSNFYPRSPCGERPVKDATARSNAQFLSTLSLRRATITDGSICFDSKISIHALLAESDSLTSNAYAWTLIFLSTLSLRRATRNSGLLIFFLINFYPRSPCGERHLLVERWRKTLMISIHALLAESDFNPAVYDSRRRNFYPRSPCGERLFSILNFSICTNFYPRSPCGERPSNVRRILSAMAFLSTLSLRRAT